MLRQTALIPGASAGIGRQLAHCSCVMDASEVARTGYDGWKRGKVLVIPGLANRLGVFSIRVGSRAMVRTITKRVNSLQPE